MLLMYKQITFPVIVAILLIGIVSVALCEPKAANGQSKTTGDTARTAKNMTGDTARTAKNMTGGTANLPKNILDIP